ncbi:hypothetical protein O181_006550 [Austropuccinia psidii MF-1]|uniref:RhoGAP-domain-containing protein n=1 Tax=Austropuccinia psidii MF-1 TaxID=1389203 RepID=A0A9Q3BKM4_9BASI|nr:hypothetical protein [Austropuccinia psidii MF-1]
MKFIHSTTSSTSSSSSTPSNSASPLLSQSTHSNSNHHQLILTPSSPSSSNLIIEDKAVNQSNHDHSSPTNLDQNPHSNLNNPNQIICNGCKSTLEENGSANDSLVVSFGNSLWHVDCFRCAKCRNLVEHDTNLLLLSDGSPVCENCSYICSVCKQPISNEAIVTGEESYHADCFRCRSCSNRIEELIFAKTSQGIYCMTCHNERVTRSRRHAEAKRNKSNSNNQSSKKDHRKDKLNHHSSSNRSKSKNSIPTSHHHHQLQSLNDLPSHLPSSSSSPTIDSSHIKPSLSSSHQSSQSLSIPSTFLEPAKPVLPNLPNQPHLPARSLSPTNPSITTLSRESNSLDFDRSLQTSKSSSSNLNPFNSPSSPNRHQHQPNVHLGNLTHSSSSRPSTPDGPDLIQNINHSIQSPSIDHSHNSSPSHPSFSEASNNPIGLLPKFDKLNRRRSGFIGLNLPLLSGVSNLFTSVSESINKTTVESLEANQINITDPKHESLLRRKLSLDSSFDLHPQPSQTSATIPQSTSDQTILQLKVDPTLSKSERPLSFYDPEVLLLLSSPTEPPPQSNSLEKLLESSKSFKLDISLGDPGLQTVESKQMEKDGLKIKSSELMDSNQTQHAQTKRQSIDLSRVENLLFELQQTKQKMKKLQDEYDIIQPIIKPMIELEGIKESRIAEFKVNNSDQTGSLSEEIQAANQLKEESDKLRQSVHGLQNHLSQLVIERDLRVAEVESLNHINRNDRKNAINETRHTLDHSKQTLDENLSGRLESIRDTYRREVDELVKERDQLKQEILHLSGVKESHIKELASLNHRQDVLAELNSSAMKQLEETRGALSKVNGRVGSSSVSKPTAQSPPPPINLGLESDYIGNTSPEVNIATTRKFKWGKSSTHKASNSANGRSHIKNAGSVSGIELGINILTHSNHSTGMLVPNTLSPSGLTGLNGSNNYGSSINTNGSITSGYHTNSGTSLSGSIGGNGSMTNLRPHNFQPVSALRPVRCDYCGDKLWGLTEVRCSVCGSYSHSKCAPNFFGCHAITTTSNSTNAAGGGEEDNEIGLFGNDLIAQARSENKSVPSVVIKCIEAVEKHGLQFEGIYRKTGGMSSIKMIQSCFEKGTNIDLSDLNKFNDVSAITSTLKNYFRQLPNPLFTFELHEAFVNVATINQELNRLETLERVIYQLPQVHFETLKVLMNHLNRIERLSEFNKMTPQNLGVVFGPTLLRSENPNRQFSDMPLTAKVVELTVLNTVHLFRRPFGTSNQTHLGYSNLVSSNSGYNLGNGINSQLNSGFHGSAINSNYHSNGISMVTGND